MESTFVDNEHYDEACSVGSSSGSEGGYGGRESGHMASIVTGSVMGPNMGGVAGEGSVLGALGGGEGRAEGPRGYDASAFAGLDVSPEVADLFGYIERYWPTSFDIETKLKPFVPEFIPAIGDIDGFLKIPRPDGREDGLALAVVDEPCTKQSDPAVLNLQLRANSKKSNLAPMEVRSVDPEKEPKAITSWIENIADMHAKKPLPSVAYSKLMPDIEGLMQEWPQDFDKVLAQNPDALPDASLDVDVGGFARIVCALLDIPVHDSVVESLHVLFTLYLEAKNHQGVAFD